MSFEQFSEERIGWIDKFLEESVANFRSSTSQRFGALIDSMHYSLDGGGKRLRPLLVLASAECLGLSPRDVLPAACAVEYIHTYSLIHDDLPALDDDDMRRGKPSNHKKFGEAVAILTGDALLTEAFGLMYQMAQKGAFTATHVLSAIELLVNQSGIKGMVGGQLLDVTTNSQNYSLPEIEFIHIHKTGALILCSVLLPTRLVPVEEKRLRAFRRYGEAIGLAFQISDDLLDSEAPFRYSRGPRKKMRPSYTHIMSPAEMKEKLHSLIDTALDAIRNEGSRAEQLIEIAEFIRRRK